MGLERCEEVLKKVQALDPIGVAARDLRECLLLQVRHLNADTPEIVAIIERHLKHLESKNYPAIAKDLKIPIEEVVKAVKVISRLEPKPGRAYTGEEAQYITPDVYVHKMGDRYVTVLNDDGLSKLRISAIYRAALKNGQAGKAKDYIQDKLRSAVWLIRSIHQRQRTIYKVTESIVKFQRDFLDKGIAYLKPLILRDVAEDIGMHESTVSRVTTNKYVHTPQGIYELKFFFNSAINKHRRRRDRQRGGQEPHQADRGRRGPEAPPLRPAHRRAAAGAGDRDRPPHGGQVPRGAGHPAQLQAEEVLLIPVGCAAPLARRGTGPEKVGGMGVPPPAALLSFHRACLAAGSTIGRGSIDAHPGARAAAEACRRHPQGTHTGGGPCR